MSRALVGDDTGCATATLRFALRSPLVLVLVSPASAASALVSTPGVVRIAPIMHKGPILLIGSPIALGAISVERRRVLVLERACHAVALPLGRTETPRDFAPLRYRSGNLPGDFLGVVFLDTEVLRGQEREVHRG